jgi:acid phosphatase type 7
MRTRLRSAAVVIACSLLLGQCGGSGPSSPTTPPGGGGGGGGNPGDGNGGGTGSGNTGPATVLAAGDIGECGFGAHETGEILDRLPGTLLALGDLAYMHGNVANFRDYYDPAWGRHLGRTRPVPGNHEYETPGASTYYDYFGSVAGIQGAGYYAFTAGSWRVIALNSEIPMGSGSPQMQWLRNELETNRTACTLAYWHRPLFSSGPNGNNPDMRPFWRTLMEFRADVVLNGHDHMYERFGPQDADGRADGATGIRQFVVGTGGAHLYAPEAAKPNSEIRARVYGILMLTLTTNAYSWEFVSNTAFRESGSGVCH